MSNVLNNPTYLVLFIIAIVALVIATLYIAIPFLVKKGYPVVKYLQEAETGLVQIKSTLDLVGKVAPIPYNVILDKVLDLSAMAVNGMEQLYIKGQVDIQSRKPLAVQYVHQGLALMKIDATPDIDKLIDLAIEGAVYLLPKTHEDNIEAKPAPDKVDAVKTQMISDMHSDILATDAAAVIASGSPSPSPVNIHIYTNGTNSPTILATETSDKLNSNEIGLQ